MASHNYGLLDQAEEEEIYKSRLLSVEAKPFSRISSRLLHPSSLLTKPPVHLPTPPPDGDNLDEASAAKEAEREKLEEQHRIWREECLLDFASFESSIVRIQLLHNSNELERARYAAEKVKIQDTAQKVKENTAQLHLQLEEAQKTLALRKTYDQLTDKILSNRMLKPREDQHVQLEKLNAEIDELEREKEQYAETWGERRIQFNRIVEEGKNMLRMIRDEKEEAERKEGMEGGEDAEDAEGSTVREASRVGTPRPDGNATPMHKGGEEDEISSQLSVLKDKRAPSTSRVGSNVKSDPDTMMQDQDQIDSEGEIEEGETEEHESMITE